MGNKLLLCALFFCLVIPSLTYAQMGQNLGISNPKATALAHAVTADPPGLNSIHFNPAGLAKIKGRQRSFNVISANFKLQGTFSKPTNDPFADLNLEFTLDGDEPCRNSCLFGEDPIFADGQNSVTSTSDRASAYLPFVGFTKAPEFMIAPVGASFSFSPTGSNWTIGTSTYATMGGGLSREADDPARFQGRAAAVTRITYLSPTFAYQVNDHWSLGLSLGASYFGFKLNTDLRIPNALLGIVDQTQQEFCNGGANPLAILFNICGGAIGPYEDFLNLDAEVEDYYSFTFNFGVLWEPTPWFSWGFVYQSPSKDTLEGDFLLTYNENVVEFVSDQGFRDSPQGQFIGDLIGLPSPGSDGTERGSITMVLETPAHVATGVSMQVSPKWKVNFDVKWTDFSVWQSFDIKFIDKASFIELLAIADRALGEYKPDTFSIPRGYQESFSWALGVEYHYSQRLALRAGYEPRPTAIPDDKRDFMYPFNEAVFYGLGFSYQWKKNTLFDVAIGHFRSHDEIPAGTSTNLNAVTLDNLKYNPYAGLDAETSVKITFFEFSYQSEF